MESENNFPSNTWTAYPSLLRTLPRESHRALLEHAACAHYCGRYDDADAIFQRELLDAEAVPIVVFQRADMLTSQGHEAERLTMLQRAQEAMLKEGEDQSESIRLLFELMLADAQFWGRGSTKGLMKALRGMKQHLRSTGLDNFSDVEMRGLTLYYSLLDSLASFSNTPERRDKTLFSVSRGDRAVEINELYSKLYARSQWRIVATAMQLRLAHARSDAAVEECTALIEMLRQRPESALKFRSTVLAKMMGNRMDAQYTATLQQITPTRFATWQDFCPIVAFDLKRATLDSESWPDAERFDRLQTLVQDAMSRLDYTKANQTYFEMRNVGRRLAMGNRKDGNIDDLERLRHSQQAHIAMTRSAGLQLFEAAVLADHLSALLIIYREPTPVLSDVQQFVQTHPGFAIPNIWERLYDSAMQAAKTLGLNAQQNEFQDGYDSWINKCSFMTGGGGTTDEAISNPDFALREIYTAGDSLVEWGTGALRLMLRWAGWECSEGYLSADLLSYLFGVAVGQVPIDGIVEHVQRVDAAELSEGFFGSIENPLPTNTFILQYRALLAWITTPERPPSLDTRLQALYIFLQSRQYRFRKWLIDTEGSHTLGEMMREEENAVGGALRELQRLREVRSEEQAEWAQDDFTACHISLRKSLDRETVLGGGISDEELENRCQRCRQLVNTYRASQSSFHEYTGLCMLMRLSMQRYLLFQSVTPENVVDIAEEGEAAFIATRNAIAFADPASNLVARVKLSQNSKHREHYNLALAATWRGFDDRLKQNKKTPSPVLQTAGFNSFLRFLEWSLRSKGRGFTDILNLETAVPFAASAAEAERAPDAAQDDLESALGAITTRLGNVVLSTDRTLRGSAISKEQFDVMLKRLPDGLAIVDFIEVKYGNSDEQLMAMVYRRNRLVSLPLQFPTMNMNRITDWVMRNLGHRRLRHQPLLSQQDSALDDLLDLGNVLAHAIPPGETIVLCPTGDLNRVPIHAITVDQAPLIQRNPIVYCQSPSILYWLWQKSPTAQQSTDTAKSSIINPMPDTWTDGSPVHSTPAVQAIATSLHGTLHRGFALTAAGVMHAVQQSSIFHYHGHVQFRADSALDSAMILNETAFRSMRLGGVEYSGAEMLSARNLFAVRLAENALVSLMGCGSGVAAVSSTDDVLGLPTALFYAGASAVVSTLWPVEDEDAAGFATAFYDALQTQRTGSSSTMASRSGTLDVARAVQSAVLSLLDGNHMARLEDQEQEGAPALAPYHWAAFTLNGFWALRADVFPTG